MEIKRYLKNYISERETLEKNIKTLDTIKEQYKISNLVFSQKELYPYVVVSKEVIKKAGEILKLTSRESEDRVLINDGYELSSFEALPFKMDYIITAKHVNNIKTMTNIEWGLEKLIDDAQQKFIEKLREALEIMSIQALSGKIKYPMNKGGFYELDYEIQEEKRENLESISLEDLQNLLLKTKSELESSGDLYFLISDGIYTNIFKQIINAKLGVISLDGGINFAGFNILPISSKRKGFQILEDQQIIAVDIKGGHKVLYCAIDSFDAGLQATPLYCEIEESGGKLLITAQSKPFLVVNSRAIKIIKEQK